MKSNKNKNKSDKKTLVAQEQNFFFSFLFPSLLFPSLVLFVKFPQKSSRVNIPTLKFQLSSIIRSFLIFTCERRYAQAIGNIGVQWAIVSDQILFFLFWKIRIEIQQYLQCIFLFLLIYLTEFLFH